MGVRQCISDFPREPDRLVYGEASLPNELRAERLAIDERHREPESSGRLARIEQRKHVRMDHPSNEPDLAVESIASTDDAELGSKHLERDVPLVLKVACEVHDCHATGAELALDVVSTGKSLTELFDRIRTGGRWNVH